MGAWFGGEVLGLEAYLAALATIYRAFCFGKVSLGHVGSQYPAALLWYGDIFFFFFTLFSVGIVFSRFLDSFFRRIFLVVQAARFSSKGY